MIREREKEKQSCATIWNDRKYSNLKYIDTDQDELEQSNRRRNISAKVKLLEFFNRRQKI